MVQKLYHVIINYDSVETSNVKTNHRNFKIRNNDELQIFCISQTKHQHNKSLIE